jgi:hypothetical protein
MEQEPIKTIEADLREVVEAEISKFIDRYSECKRVDSIYFNENVSIGVYDIPLHGLICNHYLNIFVTNDRLYEFPEFSCYVVFEDKERDFRRALAHIMLIYTPVTNKCFIKTELHEYEISDVAKHIVKTAKIEEAEGEEA